MEPVWVGRSGSKIFWSSGSEWPGAIRGSYHQYGTSSVTGLSGALLNVASEMHEVHFHRHRLAIDAVLGRRVEVELKQVILTQPIGPIDDDIRTWGRCGSERAELLRDNRCWVVGIVERQCVERTVEVLDAVLARSKLRHLRSDLYRTLFILGRRGRSSEKSQPHEDQRNVALNWTSILALR